MIPAKLRKMLDPGARRRMRSAARERADALDRGDEAAADAVTARYVAGEWARKTPRIVPAPAPERRTPTLSEFLVSRPRPHDPLDDPAAASAYLDAILTPPDAEDR